MSNDGSEELVDRLKFEVLKVERQFAFEKTGAVSARRSKVRQVVDRIIGESEKE